MVGKLSDQIYPEKEKPKSLGTGIDELKEKMRQVPVICWILLLIIVLWITDRKMRKRKENMKIIDLKKVNSILLVMVIFLSYQIPVWADTDHTTVKIPVQQIFSSEAEDISADVLML